MADNRIPAGRAPANLSRADRIDLLLWATGAFVIAFLPQLLACCGVL